MNAPEYSLPFSDASVMRRVRRWLILGVLALGFAGIFAGLLANTKSPFFYTALVVHVDLSVLVWFLTIACMFFTLTTHGRGAALLADAGFICFACGTLLLIGSAFTGGAPYMSNYIPVIHHPLFFFSLSLLLCGVLLVIANLLTCKPTHLGIHSAAWIMLIAIICFIWSARTVPTKLSGQIYYEYLFWGGGHVLQFVHTQLMIVCWFWLAIAGGMRIQLRPKHFAAIYIFGLLAAIAAPIIYLAHDVSSDEYRNAFTLLMRHAGGLMPLVVGTIILFSFVFPAKAGISGQPQKIPAFAGMTLAKIVLFMSILLFAAGGALGYLIAGSNVTVPAHYHGSIVGVTLAFMGVAYQLLPTFGWRDVSASLLARIQPILYGGGQLCWMTGMAILGAHGVPRKTPGSADTVGAAASFLKHGGDGLALIGGLLFVFVVLRAVYQSQRKLK